MVVIFDFVGEKAVHHDSFLQLLVPDVFAQLNQTLRDPGQLALATQVLDLFIVGVVERPDLRLQLFAFVVQVLDSLNQRPQLSRKLFLLLRYLPQIGNGSLILFIDAYFRPTYEQQLILECFN